MQYEELDIPRFGPRAAPTVSYRARRRQPGNRRLMMMAGIGGAALLLVGGWSLISHRNGPIPVIQADSRPYRVRPEVRGGMQVTGANEDIMSGDALKQTDTLAAPAEVPRTEQLRQMQLAEQERTEAAAHPPATDIPIVAPTSLTSTPTITPTSTKAEASALALATPAAAPPSAPTAAIKPADPARPGKTAVQLAAVASQEGAHQFWQRLAARMPELLAGRKPELTRIDRDGRVFWRVRLDGFADTEAAEHFCEQVHGKGGGCSVAAF